MVFSGNPEKKNVRLLIEVCVLLMAFVAIMFFLSNEVNIGGAAIVGLMEPAKLIES